MLYGARAIEDLETSPSDFFINSTLAATLYYNIRLSKPINDMMFNGVPLANYVMKQHTVESFTEDKKINFARNVRDYILSKGRPEDGYSFSIPNIEKLKSMLVDLNDNINKPTKRLKM